jgi:hypothetical protein
MGGLSTGEKKNAACPSPALPTPRREKDVLHAHAHHQHQDDRHRKANIQCDIDIPLHPPPTHPPTPKKRAPCSLGPSHPPVPRRSLVASSAVPPTSPVAIWCCELLLLVVLLRHAPCVCARCAIYHKSQIVLGPVFPLLPLALSPLR